MSESQQSPAPPVYDDEIDLRALFGLLWKGKWLIGGITAAAAVISVIVALMLPNIYRAEALLAPNDQEGAGGLSALAAQYGGLASLAGISLGSGSSDRTLLGLEILKSRKFISEFIERRDILVPLMAATGWDTETRKLIIDPHQFDVVTEQWVRDVNPPKKPVPSLQEAYRAFSDILSVSQDKKSGLVTVGIEHLSPDVAKQWTDWLIQDLNSSIMRQDVAEAEQAIHYLNGQIKNTSLSGLKEVFFSLIEEQTKTVMLASVTDEYLLKTVDPAITPEKRHRPSRSLIVILSTLFGGLISLVAVFVLNEARA